MAGEETNSTGGTGSPAAQVLLGFDYGTKRIGVAVGQELTGTANPLLTVKARDGKPDWPAISVVIGSWHPQGLVVGVPLNMDGSEQTLTHAARRFGRQLRERYRLPVYYADERLSSVEAQRRIRSSGRRGREDLDQRAACIILETWLGQHIRARRGGRTTQQTENTDTE